MALAHELDKSVETGSLSDESKGITFGEVIRDYEPLPDTKWRFGKPNYARVNKFYFENRMLKHKEGSLEAVVSNIVKNCFQIMRNVSIYNNIMKISPDVSTQRYSLLVDKISPSSGTSWSRRLQKKEFRPGKGKCGDH